jgi:pyruvate kinase
VEKPVVVEGKDYDISLPAEADVEALKKISHLSQEVDYVSVSLARSYRDVDNVKTLLSELGVRCATCREDRDSKSCG